jgi:hypothetical protein
MTSNGVVIAPSPRDLMTYIYGNQSGVVVTTLQLRRSCPIAAILLDQTLYQVRPPISNSVAVTMQVLWLADTSHRILIISQFEHILTTYQHKILVSRKAQP